MTHPIESFQDFEVRLMRIDAARQKFLEAVETLREMGDEIWLEGRIDEILVEMSHERL